MAEIIVVVRSRRQQRDARIAAAGEHREVGLHALEEGRQTHAVAGFEQIAGHVCVHDAVGERVADAGRGLGVVVDDAPAAVGLTRKVDGIEVQVSRVRVDAVAGAEEGRIGEQQRRRDQAIAQKLLRAVGVGENGVEQTRALDERRLEGAPFGAGKDEGDKVDLPAFSRRGRVGKDVVRDAHLAHSPIELVGALRLLGGGQFGESCKEALPVRADLPVGIHQFVIAAAAQAGIAGEQSLVELQSEPRFQVHDLTFMGRCPADCASLPAWRFGGRREDSASRCAAPAGTSPGNTESIRL